MGVPMVSSGLNMYGNRQLMKGARRGRGEGLVVAEISLATEKVDVGAYEGELPSKGEVSTQIPNSLGVREWGVCVCVIRRQSYRKQTSTRDIGRSRR